MKRFSPVFLLLSLSTAAACSAPLAEDEATADEAELKKKVNPQGSEGTFTLTKPAWATPTFDEGLSFGGRPIKLGDSVPRPPGTYGLVLGSSSSSVVVTAGASQALLPAGLLVRYAAPVNEVWFARDQIVVEGATGHAIRSGARAVTLPVHAGQYDVRSPSYSWKGSTAAGALTELIIPTATLVLQVDPVDPAFPSASPDCLRMRSLRTDIDQYPNYTASRWSVSPPVRDLATGPVNVPAGNAVRLATGGSLADRNGTDLMTWPVQAGTTTTITLNRLEVDDVASPTPGAPRIKGTFDIDMKKSGAWTPYACGRTVPTHTGVDLPDGDYRVTTVADGPNGRITHVEELTFP
jgi:hypothetical protein